MGKAGDKAANREIEKTYDLLHSSPARSAPAVRGLEASIMEQIEALENAVRTGEDDLIVATAGGIIEATEERNRKLRLLN